MYRALTQWGLLVLNEYSEATPKERLRRMMHCVRELRRFFAEVHVVRPTVQNTLFFALVEKPQNSRSSSRSTGSE